MRESILTIDDTQLYCTRLGDSGVPILMMHGGLGLDHAYFRPVLDDLGQQHQLIYYDHRGNGQSQRQESWTGVDLGRLADDAEALRAALGLSQIVLYGHSYGGFVAQEYASRYPDRLLGLILSNTSPNLADYPVHFPAWATETSKQAFGELFSAPPLDDEAFQQAWLDILPMYWRDLDPALAKDIDHRTHYCANAWRAALDLLGNFQMKGKLQHIQAPALVLGGTLDFITPAQAQRDIAEELPRARLTLFEDADHFPFYSANTAYIERIESWLDDL